MTKHEFDNLRVGQIVRFQYSYNNVITVVITEKPMGHKGYSADSKYSTVLFDDDSQAERQIPSGEYWDLESDECERMDIIE